MAANWQLLVKTLNLTDEDMNELVTLLCKAKANGYCTLGVEFTNHEITMYHFEQTLKPKRIRKIKEINRLTTAEELAAFTRV